MWKVTLALLALSPLFNREEPKKDDSRRQRNDSLISPRGREQSVLFPFYQSRAIIPVNTLVGVPTTDDSMHIGSVTGDRNSDNEYQVTFFEVSHETLNSVHLRSENLIQLPERLQS